MRFHVGAIPIDDFEPDDSWQSLREPGPLLMQLFALPIAVVLLLVFGVFWKDYLAIEPLEIPSEYTVLFGLATIASLPLLVVVHELLHAVAHPGYGRQSATIIGAWPQKMLFYAHYCGELSRNRFLLVFAMPFVVISLLPLAMFAVGILPPAFASVAAWFSIWNALFASGDVFGFFLIFWQVPSHSIVRNKGWRTYWKPA